MSHFTGLAHFEKALKAAAKLEDGSSDIPWKIFFGLVNKSQTFKDATGKGGKIALGRKEKDDSAGRIDCRPMLVYRRINALNIPIFLGKLRAKLTKASFTILKLESVSIAKQYPGCDEASSEVMPCIKGAITFDGRGFVFLFGLIDIKKVDAESFNYDPNKNTLGQHLVGRIEIYKYAELSKQKEKE